MPGLGGRFARAKSLQAGPGMVHYLVAFFHLRHLLSQTSEPVEEPQGGLSLEQGLLLVLAIDMHKPLADLAEHGHSGKSAVEIDAPAPVLGDHPSYQQLPVSGVAALF